ncbi:MAG: DUF4199 domain-containing protein [Candidatus Cyclobacteriaceae bacterium M3_2C_046]
MTKTAFTYGLLAGLIVTGLFHITNYLFDLSTNFELGELIGYINMILAFSMIYLGIRFYRNHQPDQRIKFGKAFLLGLYITGVASVLYVVGWIIYSSQNPEIMDHYFNQAIIQIKNSGESASVIAQKVAEMEAFKESYQNPLVQIGFTILEIFPVGLLVSLISALILKSKKEPSRSDLVSGK